MLYTREEYRFQKHMRHFKVFFFFFILDHSTETKIKFLQNKPISPRLQKSYMLPNEKINVTLRKKKIIFQFSHFTMVGVSIPSDQFSQFSQALAMFSHYMVSNTKINKQKYPFHYFQIEGCKRYSLWSRIMQFYSFFPLLLFSASEV